MQSDQQSDELLKVLLDAGVELVVVGGFAAIAHGMDRSTKDVDVLVNMTVENVTRLVTSLQPYEPRHLLRKDLGIIRVDAAERLASFDFLLLTTTIGRLDVIARLDPIGGFDDVDRVELELFPGRSVAVISLEQLIEVKLASGRPRDVQDAQELKALLELTRANRRPLDDLD